MQTRVKAPVPALTPESPLLIAMIKPLPPQGGKDLYPVNKQRIQEVQPAPPLGRPGQNCLANQDTAGTPVNNVNNTEIRGYVGYVSHAGPQAVQLPTGRGGIRHKQLKCQVATEASQQVCPSGLPVTRYRSSSGLRGLTGSTLRGAS